MLDGATGFGTLLWIVSDGSVVIEGEASGDDGIDVLAGSGFVAVVDAGRTPLSMLGEAVGCVIRVAGLMVGSGGRVPKGLGAVGSVVRMAGAGGGIGSERMPIAPEAGGVEPTVMPGGVCGTVIGDDGDGDGMPTALAGITGLVPIMGRIVPVLDVPAGGVTGVPFE